MLKALSTLLCILVERFKRPKLKLFLQRFPADDPSLDFRRLREECSFCRMSGTRSIGYPFKDGEILAEAEVHRSDVCFASLRI